MNKPAKALIGVTLCLLVLSIAAPSVIGGVAGRVAGAFVVQVEDAQLRAIYRRRGETAPF